MKIIKKDLKEELDLKDIQNLRDFVWFINRNKDFISLPSGKIQKDFEMYLDDALKSLKKMM